MCQDYVKDSRAPNVKEKAGKEAGKVKILCHQVGLLGLLMQDFLNVIILFSRIIFSANSSSPESGREDVPSISEQLSRRPKKEKKLEHLSRISDSCYVCHRSLNECAETWADVRFFFFAFWLKTPSLKGEGIASGRSCPSICPHSPFPLLNCEFGTVVP